MVLKIRTFRYDMPEGTLTAPSIKAPCFSPFCFSRKRRVVSCQFGRPHLEPGLCMEVLLCIAKCSA